MGSLRKLTSVVELRVGRLTDASSSSQRQPSSFSSCQTLTEDRASGPCAITPYPPPCPYHSLDHHGGSTSLRFADPTGRSPCHVGARPAAFPAPTTQFPRPSRATGNLV